MTRNDLSYRQKIKCIRYETLLLPSVCSNTKKQFPITRKKSQRVNRLRQNAQNSFKNYFILSFTCKIQRYYQNILCHFSQRFLVIYDLVSYIIVGHGYNTFYQSQFFVFIKKT